MVDPTQLLSEEHKSLLTGLLNNQVGLNGPVLKTSLYSFGLFSKTRLGQPPMMKILPMRSTAIEYSLYDDINLIHDELIWQLHDRLDSLLTCESGWELVRLTNLHCEV